MYIWVSSVKLPVWTHRIVIVIIVAGIFRMSVLMNHGFVFYCFFLCFFVVFFFLMNPNIIVKVRMAEKLV